MRIWRWLLVIGCAKDSVLPGEPPGGLSTSLHREPATGPDPFTVRVSGAASVQVRADGVAVAVDATDTGFEARIEPEVDGSVVALEIVADGVTHLRHALVLPVVDDAWDQPELVPGLVNTPGYEDSSEVSPDGAWLIVSSYATIDAVTCLTSFGPNGLPDPAADACNRSRGPYDAPERPDMPGADRILSPTEIDHRIPELGLVGADGGAFLVPLPPVAAYGFARQPDGTFAEPFPIAVDMYGLPNAPFGFTFVDAPDGASARLVFSWADPSTGGEDADLFEIDATLGPAVSLGALRLQAGAYVFESDASRLPMAEPERFESNPFVAPDGVYFDQHVDGIDELDLWYAPRGSNGGYGPAEVVGVSQPGRSEYQPYLHDQRLFFAADGFVTIRSAALTGDDPRAAASFGPERVDLGAGGTVAAIGEPSVATEDGQPVLYFIAGRITAEGAVDADVARVRAR